MQSTIVRFFVKQCKNFNFFFTDTFLFFIVFVAFSGFNATSRLCHTCAFNHRRIGTHRCARCPASAEMVRSTVLPFLTFILHTVRLYLRVYTYISTLLLYYYLTLFLQILLY